MRLHSNSFQVSTYQSFKIFFFFAIFSSFLASPLFFFIFTCVCKFNLHLFYTCVFSDSKSISKSGNEEKKPAEISHLCSYNRKSSS